jgi:hypothetical protein
MIFTEKEAFRIGFFKRAAELGRTPSEAVTLYKSALDLSSLGTVALLGLGVPALGGAITGGIHADMEDVSKEEVNRAKQRQRIKAMIDEAAKIELRLRHQADRQARAY